VDHRGGDRVLRRLPHRVPGPRPSLAGDRRSRGGVHGHPATSHALHAATLPLRHPLHRAARVPLHPHHAHRHDAVASPRGGPLGNGSCCPCAGTGRGLLVAGVHHQRRSHAAAVPLVVPARGPRLRSGVGDGRTVAGLPVNGFHGRDQLPPLRGARSSRVFPALATGRARRATLARSSHRDRGGHRLCVAHPRHGGNTDASGRQALGAPSEGESSA
jgi:hypothetical protein